MRKVFLTALMIFMMSAATALAANWQQIYLDDTDNKIFFDTDSVQITEMTSTRDDVIFDALFRMDYSDKGRTALIDWYRDYSRRCNSSAKATRDTIAFLSAFPTPPPARNSRTCTTTARTTTGKKFPLLPSLTLNTSRQI